MKKMKKILINCIPIRKYRHLLREKYLKKKEKSGNIIQIVHSDGTVSISKNDICGLKIFFEGKNSKVILHEPFAFEFCEMHIGSNNIVSIEKNIYAFHKLRIPYKMADGASLYIGEGGSCVGLDIYLHDAPAQSVVIGKDLMASFDVVIWPSDGHTIFDLETKQVINEPKNNIVIGDHVWLCRGVNLLKNTIIPNNTVVGFSATLSQQFTEENTIIVGRGKIVKRGINWSRLGLENYKQKMENLK